MLTLADALQYNNSRTVSKQSRQQVTSWYGKGYCLGKDGKWYSAIDNRPKYSTAN